jgi:hypothetical protein
MFDYFISRNKLNLQPDLVIWIGRIFVIGHAFLKNPAQTIADKKQISLD